MFKKGILKASKFESTTVESAMFEKLLKLALFIGPMKSHNWAFFPLSAP